MILGYRMHMHIVILHYAHCTLYSALLACTLSDGILTVPYHTVLNHTVQMRFDCMLHVHSFLYWLCFGL